MNYYCHSCGTKNTYVNGVKPKFCTNCGEPLAGNTINNKTSEAKGRPSREESRSDWRSEWGKTSSQINEEEDIDEIMRGLKNKSGVNVEKAKFLTVADLKEMPAESTGRDAAPQANDEMAKARAEIMKNLGVQNNNAS